MRRIFAMLAGLFLAVGLTSLTALAQSGSGGSGSGSGVTVGCGSASNTTAQNISACGSVSVSTTPTVGGTQYSLSGPLTVQATGSNPAVEAAIGDDLTPGAGAETLDFSLTSAFVSTGGTASGNFTLTDFTGAGGDADFEVDGTILALVPSGNSSVGSWVLTLAPTSVIFGGSCECAAFDIPLSGVTGTMTINFDPGSVTSASLGIGGGPFGTSNNGAQTPEPSTLLLLASGLPALGFVRRKFMR